MSQLPLPGSGGIRRSAEFSPCRTWRYTLVRVWDDDLPRLLFVLLNPSTADEYQDDPTNRRAISFARQWGYGSVVFVNLFAFRSPDPRVMKEAVDPVGRSNDAHIGLEAEKAHKIVAAWGVHGTYQGRDVEVLELLSKFDLWCMGVTKDGHPKHPLYLSEVNDPQTVRRLIVLH